MIKLREITKKGDVERFMVGVFFNHVKMGNGLTAHF